MLKFCGRCGVSKPQPEWYPSQWNGAGKWCRDCYRAWHRDRYATSNSDEPRICRLCGGEFQPRQRNGATFCSRSCKDAARLERDRRDREASKPERTCLHCGSTMPQSMRADARFCSARCNSNAHAAGRRKKIGDRGDRDGVIKRQALFDRDGYECALCGELIDPSLRWPDVMSPSIDHILPLSKGGSHYDENLRVVHFSCNARRGARDLEPAAGATA